MSQISQHDPIDLLLIQDYRDAWNVEESIKFYRGTLAIDNELGVSGRVYHETHRNRSLFTPYATLRILNAVTEYNGPYSTSSQTHQLMAGRLRITADFSHWMVGCERLLDISESDIVMMNAIIPHVRYSSTNPAKVNLTSSRYTTSTLELGQHKLRSVRSR